MTPVAEAVGDGLGGGSDSNGDAIHRLCRHAVAERDAARPNNMQLRPLAARSAGLPVDEQPDPMRELCRESVHLERTEKAERALGMPLRDFGERGRLRQICIGEAIEATGDTLDRPSVGEPSQVGPWDRLLIEIASPKQARLRELDTTLTLDGAFFAMRS